jgi:hypothetical protein
MTWFEIYAFFGVPAILFAMAYAAVRLAERDAHRFDEAPRPAEPGSSGSERPGTLTLRARLPQPCA